LTVQLKLPAKFKPLFQKIRFKIFYGGRGGAKTESFIRVLLIEAQKGKRILCLREYLNSIDDSCHATIQEIINLDGFTGFTVLRNEIRHSSGGGFKYGQLARNLSSIKSKSVFDIAWVEEAETVTEESINFLEPTIRKSGSELWYSFNPVREDGAIYSKYVKPYLDAIAANGSYHRSANDPLYDPGFDDDIYVAKVGLDDNPWAPHTLRAASKQMRNDNFDLWLHVYGGEPKRDLDDVIIQPKWVEASINAHIKLGFEPIGVKSLGFDPADEGEDAKAVCHRHGSVVDHLSSWTKGDLEDGINRAFDCAYDMRSEFLVFDGDGLGAGVKIGLSKRLEGKRVVVENYKGGKTVDNPTAKYKGDDTNKNTFKNKRAQYWWYLRDRFYNTYLAVEKGHYIDPEELISLDAEALGKPMIDMLKGELTRVMRLRTNNSIIQLESKKDMRGRGVKSPNCADAIVLAFANPPPKMKPKKISFASGW